MNWEKLFGMLSIGAIVIELDNNSVTYANKLAITYFSISDKNNINTFIYDEAINEKVKYSLPIENLEMQINDTTYLVDGNLISDSEEDYYVLYFKPAPLITAEKLQQSLMEKEFFYSVYEIVYGDLSEDEKINTILEMMGHFTNTDLAYIYELDQLTDTFSVTYEWFSDKKYSKIDTAKNLELSQIAWQDTILDKNWHFVFNEKKHLHLVEKRENDFRLKSTVLFPVFSESDKISAMVVFDCYNEDREWTEPELKLIKMISYLSLSLLTTKKIEATKAIYYETTKTVFDNMDLNIYVNNVETYELLFANKALLNSFGYKSFKEIEGKTCYEVIQQRDSPCSDDYCPMSALKKAYGLETNKVLKSERFNAKVNKWFLLEDSFIKWIDGSLGHLESSTEFSEYKKSQLKLEQLASLDSLTRIYNREWGLENLNVCLKKSKIKCETICVCFIDIDGLKTVNDMLGHEEGDVLIKSTVNLILYNIRKSDIFFRHGGDEFILVLENSNQTNSTHVIQKIRHSIDEFNKLSDLKFNISLSIGIQEVTASDNIDTKDIIALADKKMYEEKINKDKNIIK